VRRGGSHAEKDRRLVVEPVVCKLEREAGGEVVRVDLEADLGGMRVDLEGGIGF